jgi:homoserine dehydrogenase
MVPQNVSSLHKRPSLDVGPAFEEDPSPIDSSGLRPITVLKFGSSVLDRKDGLSQTVYEIYRQLRRGRRVVAVVSAFKGVTDWPFQTAERHFERPQPTALASLVSTRETASAAFLSMALDQAGVPASVLDPALEIQGSPLDGSPVKIDVDAIYQQLAHSPVVILPGFIGRDRSGSPALLGRGGSDLTALFVAERLDAVDCRLLKDASAMYASDPRVTSTRSSRYTTATWEEALRVGGKLVQAKAVLFAKSQGRSFTVTSPLANTGTEIGPGPNRTAPAVSHEPPLKVAVFGCGTVGLGVVQRLLQLEEHFQIVGVAVRDTTRRRGVRLPSDLLVNDPWALLERRSDAIVELMGGLEPAGSLIQAALETGRHVVTANKALIAHQESSLRALADSVGRRLLFSASVGGSVPVLEQVRQLARQVPIEKIEAVLNGTCNYILDRMREGLDLNRAVQKAQKEGFAEADPGSDLSGADSAYKLAILIRAAFGLSLEPNLVPFDGIREVTLHDVREAQNANAHIKLIVMASRAHGGIQSEVRPARLPAHHPLAGARDEENRVLIYPRGQEPILLQGKGAGRWPTSLSVMADLLDLYQEDVRARGRDSCLSVAPKEIRS